MGRPVLLVCALLGCLGCAAEGPNGDWDEFKRDLRGDNMQMHSGGPGIQGMMVPPSQERSGG
jgi:hypothetical protein